MQTLNRLTQYNCLSGVRRNLTTNIVWKRILLAEYPWKGSDALHFYMQVFHRWCELVIKHKRRKYFSDVRDFWRRHQVTELWKWWSWWYCVFVPWRLMLETCVSKKCESLSGMFSYCLSSFILVIIFVTAEIIRILLWSCYLYFRIFVNSMLFSLYIRTSSELHR